MRRKIFLSLLLAAFYLVGSLAQNKICNLRPGELFTQDFGSMISVSGADPHDVFQKIDINVDKNFAVAAYANTLIVLDTESLQASTIDMFDYKKITFFPITGSDECFVLAENINGTLILMKYDIRKRKLLNDSIANFTDVYTDVLELLGTNYLLICIDKNFFFFFFLQR